MYSVKEIIKEACIRVNLGRRNQGLNDGMEETGFRLLKGIITKYNNDNLMTFTQNSMILKNTGLIHIYDEIDSLKGEYNLYFNNADELNEYEPTEEDRENDVWAILKDHPNVLYRVMGVMTDQGVTYTWYGTPVTNSQYNQRYSEMKAYEAMYQANVRNVAKINTLYLINKQDPSISRELKFIPKEKFDDFIKTAPVYTYVQKGETEWLIELKPGVVAQANYDIKMNYNEGIDVDINDDLYIPDAYTELLIVSLAYKLALQFPRLDDNQMTRLQNDMRTMIENVRTPKADVKGIMREHSYGYGRLTQDDLMSGIYLL